MSLHAKILFSAKNKNLEIKFLRFEGTSFNEKTRQEGL